MTHFWRSMGDLVYFQGEEKGKVNEEEEEKEKVEKEVEEEEGEGLE